MYHIPSDVVSDIFLTEAGVNFLSGDGCSELGMCCVTCFHCAYSWSLCGGNTASGNIPLKDEHKHV